MTIPVQVINILNKWINVNPTDYLLFDKNYNKLTSVKLNQRLNKIFGGKKVSVNNFRHTYLTDKHEETLNNGVELERDMKAMGSSINVAKNYVKKRK